MSGKDEKSSLRVKHFVPLPTLKLPRDLCHRMGIIGAIGNYQLRRGIHEPIIPPRFIAVYSVLGRWTVECVQARVVVGKLYGVTREVEILGKYSPEPCRIIAWHNELHPPDVLIHDAWDGGTWVQDYATGTAFVRGRVMHEF